MVGVSNVPATGADLRAWRELRGVPRTVLARLACVHIESLMALESGARNFAQSPHRARLLQIVAQHEAALACPKSAHAPVFWLTGLPASGKTTLATAAVTHLRERVGMRAVLLDGDDVRKSLSPDLGYRHVDRRENVRRIAVMARLIAASGVPVFVAAIAPLADHRQMARHIIGPGYREVFINAPLSTCRWRDPKRLYAAAARGDIPDMTGVQSSYEIPVSPDLVIRNVERQCKFYSCVSILVRFASTEIGLIGNGLPIDKAIIAKPRVIRA